MIDYSIILLGLPITLFFLGVNLYRRPNQFYDLVPLLLLTMATFAYLVVPSERMDLYRYFESLDYCKSLPLSEAADWNGDGLIVKNLLFWAIAQTGNKHLLPAISTAALYGVLGSITCKSCKDSKAMPFVLTMQMISMPFIEAVSNVRNMLAFAISLYVAYRDLYEHKVDLITLLGYLCSAFIHIAGITILICRVVALLYSRFPRIGLVSTFLVPIVILRSHDLLTTVTAAIPGSVGKVLSRAIFKAYASTTNASEYARTRLESGYFNYSRYVCLGIVAIIVYCAIREILLGEESSKGITSISLALASITAVWILSGTVKYWVYFVAALSTCGPSLAGELDRASSSIRAGIPGWMLRLALFVACGCRFVLELYYIDQCLVISDYIKSILNTNIVSYLVKLFL